MMRVRLVLGPLSAAWLLCQVATLAMVPAMARVSAGDAACRCAHGPDITCPMHHSIAGQARCRLQAVDRTSAAVLGALLGQIGALPPHPVVSVPTPVSATRRFAPSLPDTRLQPPEPPPPRV